MPCYTFKCVDCEYKFEIICSYSDYTDEQKCSKCLSINTARCYRDDLSNLGASVKLADSELKTIGDLAKRNSERFSNDHKESLRIKHNSYKQIGDKSLPPGMERMR